MSTLGRLAKAILPAILALALGACPDPGPDLVPLDPGGGAGTDDGSPADPGRRDPGGTTDRGGAEDPGPGDPGPADPGAKDPGPGDPGGDPGAAGCQNSGQCELGNICAGGLCVPGCAGARDCPAGLHCDPGSGPFGTCLACLSDEHCAGLKCLLGACVKPCQGDGDCAGVAGATRCVAGTCAACGQDAHCALGTVCQDRACVPGCRSARDCPEGKSCGLDAGPSGACVDCLSTTDCPGGRVCVAWACLADCAKVQCPADRPVCDPATGQCTAAPCLDECAAGQRVCLVAFPQRIRDCGSFDGDPCLDWGTDRLCPAHQQCVPGGAAGAECACANPCTEGQARCIEGSVTARDVCRVQAGTNCRYWSRESCAEGLACTGSGECRCREDCVAGRYGCNSTYPTTVFRCETDAASGCRYWDPYFVCTDGSLCGEPGCGG